MSQQFGEEFSHEDVVAALLDLVDEGVLEFGIDEDGNENFWFRQEVAVANSEESLASSS